MEVHTSIPLALAHLLLLHLPDQGLQNRIKKTRLLKTDDVKKKKKMRKHRPGLLFDTVQLAESGRLGSRVLVWLEGERRTGAALQQGTQEIVGAIKSDRDTSCKSPLLTRSQLRDVCTV